MLLKRFAACIALHSLCKLLRSTAVVVLHLAVYRKSSLFAQQRFACRAQENSRLQSKLLGLNLSEPGSRASMGSLASEGPDAIARLQSIGSMSAMIDELTAENEQAQEDIDKLVSYVEYLERKGKPIARDANQSALLETLRKENAVVREQLENKNKELVQVQTQLEKGGPKPPMRCS